MATTTIQITMELKAKLDMIGGKLQAGDGKRRSYEEIIQELVLGWEKKGKQ